MKSIEEQLARYKSVHFNPKNIKTHFIGIPLIVLAVTLLLHSIKFIFINEWLASKVGSVNVSLAVVVFIVVAMYYLMLHRLLALGMLVYLTLNLVVAQLLDSTEGILFIAIGLFIVGWVFQFIGHYYEKAKPAFVDDLSQFLIGPLFLMAEVYFSLGLASKLKSEITLLAIDKRRLLEMNSSSPKNDG